MRNAVPIPLKTKILIADDHPLFRDALAACLRARELRIDERWGQVCY